MIARNLESGVEQRLWPQEWLENCLITDAPEQQLCTLLGLFGRDYLETVSDSNSAWIHICAESHTVQAALENERSYIGVQVDPATCRKPGHIEQRRELRRQVFYADMSKWPPEDREAFEYKEAGTNMPQTSFQSVFSI